MTALRITAVEGCYQQQLFALGVLLVQRVAVRCNALKPAWSGGTYFAIVVVVSDAFGSAVGFQAIKRPHPQDVTERVAQLLSLRPAVATMNSMNVEFL